MYKLLVFSIIFVSSCASLPESTVNHSSYNIISSGAGPEDVLVDTTTREPRLLISCDERREEGIQGSIWQYDFHTKASKELQVLFPTTDYFFHPHGFSILSKKGKTYLFVINHKFKKEEEIIRFRIYKDSLVFEKSFKDGFIGEPNDLFAVDIDEFYYSDYKPVGGSLVHVKGDEFKKVVKGLAMPNGVHVLDSMNKPVVYVSTTLSHKVFKCEEENGKWKKQKLTRVKGADNFELYNDSLLVTSHSRFGKFMKHAKHKEKLSPSIVYLMHPETGEKRVVFSDKGSKISACSTGVVYNGKLYLGQVFESFILECKID